jgi:hypothetical protein
MGAIKTKGEKSRAKPPSSLAGAIGHNDLPTKGIGKPAERKAIAEVSPLFRTVGDVNRRGWPLTLTEGERIVPRGSNC